MDVTTKEIVIYQNDDGEFPFEIWLNKLKDVQGRANIRKRINRVRLGNFGDSKSVGSGVFELKIDFGPGYRVYFAIENNRIIILLCGGDKSTQEKDISKAKVYLQDYLSQ